MTQFPQILTLLADAGIEFIVVGGVAGNVHGSTRVTLDLDIVYRRSRENCNKLAEALRPYNPYLRGAPPNLPFLWDGETLKRGLNFTLATTIGDVDLLGEIAGAGTYEDILEKSEVHDPFGVKCRCISLEQLIAAKRAAGRAKDIEAVAELEAVLEERGSRQP